MAERERFELSRPLRTYGISSAAPSTELGDRSATTVSKWQWSPSSGDRSRQRLDVHYALYERFRPCDRSAPNSSNDRQVAWFGRPLASTTRCGLGALRAVSTVRPLRDHCIQ